MYYGNLPSAAENKEKHNGSTVRVTLSKKTKQKTFVQFNIIKGVLLLAVASSTVTTHVSKSSGSRSEYPIHFL